MSPLLWCCCGYKLRHIYRITKLHFKPLFHSMKQCPLNNLKQKLNDIVCRKSGENSYFVWPITRGIIGKLTLLLMSNLFLESLVEKLSLLLLLLSWRNSFFRCVSWTTLNSPYLLLWKTWLKKTSSFFSHLPRTFSHSTTFFEKGNFSSNLSLAFKEHFSFFLSDVSLSQGSQSHGPQVHH